MATRKAPVEAAEQGVPRELFWGIPTDAFPFFGDGDPRSAENAGARHRWSEQVRAAGYTVTKLREAAETDPAYQRFLSLRERKLRLCAERPEVLGSRPHSGRSGR